MNDPQDGRDVYVDDDPMSGGASAGAQNGGIIDAGAADDETDYMDSLTGRKGGTVVYDLDDDEFEDIE